MIFMVKFNTSAKEDLAMKNTSGIFEFHDGSHTMQLVDLSVDEKAFANQLGCVRVPGPVSISVQKGIP